jgi:hypothetical protein
MNGGTLPPLKASGGAYPYDAQLYGVYQPIIGWRSKQGQARQAGQQTAAVETAVRTVMQDVAVLHAAQADAGGFSAAIRAPGLPPWLSGTKVGDALIAAHQAEQQAEAASDVTPHQHLPVTAPTKPVDWHAVVQQANVAGLASKLHAQAIAGNGGAAAVKFDPALAREQVAAAVVGAVDPAMLGRMLTQPTPAKQSMDGLEVVTTLQQHADSLLANAVLSPIGLVDLYREYFFELESFLGPPVGHVWISPGGSVELYEVHTTRVTSDYQVEMATETTTRSEREITQQDELSDQVKQENKNDESLGVSASAGGGLIYHAEASTKYDLSSSRQQSEEVAHKQLRSQTERISSEIRQSAKTVFRTQQEVEDTQSRRYVLANDTNKLQNYELRRKYRRVAVQVQHTATRLCWQTFVDDPGMYLKVADLVHVAKPEDRHDPPPPQAPTPLDPKSSELTVVFPLETDPAKSKGDASPGLRYINGQGQNDSAYSGYPGADQLYIKTQKSFSAPSPGTGYRLAGVSVEGVDKLDPENDTPRPCAVDAQVDQTDPTAGVFILTLTDVCFQWSGGVRLHVSLQWNPPDPGPAEVVYEQNLKDYKAQQQREEHQAYVELVKERINLASQVQPRAEDVLREEERSIVYAQLIRQLTASAPGQVSHVTAELLRAIFDVDEMLYFVAPDWWRARQLPDAPPIGPTADRGAADQASRASSAPAGTSAATAADQASRASSAPAGTSAATAPTVRARLTRFFPGAVARNAVNTNGGTQSGGAVTADQALTPDDEIGWGGASAAGRPGYLITEASRPAPMGASLGWLIQLDGDAHRNAFLNAPWVKAVLPIRPGKEQLAIQWLQNEVVEFNEGLDATAVDAEGNPMKDKDGNEVTIGHLIDGLAGEVSTDATADDSGAEVVYEHGFDPLDQGVKINGKPFELFAQWLEILPTDQVVALEYSNPESEIMTTPLAQPKASNANAGG